MSEPRYQGRYPDEFYDWWHEHQGGQSLDRSAEGPELMHTCEDGHSWREQPDGGVSPSWGLPLTSIKYDGWDPRRCPEPEWVLPDLEHDPVICGHRYERDVIRSPRAVTCPGCGQARLPWNLYGGISCAPWELIEEAAETGHLHEPPEPRCGKPPVKTKMWTTPPGEKHPNWVPVDAGGQPAAEGAQLDLLAGSA